MSSDENEERGLKKLSLRELRTKAVKVLGSKVAAGLKLKQELVDALVETATKAVKKAVAPAKKKAPEAKKTPPKKAAAAAEKKTPPPAKKKAAAPPPPAKTKAKAKAKAKAPTVAPMTKPPKAEAAAEVYELPITRDFFLDPRRPSLPASYGDDRLLCFRREPLAIVVSWDLSAATFENGQGIALELVAQSGRLVGSVSVTAPTGLVTFDALPEGQALSVQVVRRGRVVTRGRPFMIGAAKEAGAGGAWQMTAPIDQPLPGSPERHAWPDAPAPAGSHGKSRAGSSRLSS